MKQPLLLVLFAILAAPLTRAGQTELVLVDRGQATATIVIAEEPTPAVNLAAIELQYFVEQMTGAVLPIARGREPASGVKILIGESAYTRELGLDASGYHQMEKLIKFYPDALVLLGRDDARAECRFPPEANEAPHRQMAQTIDYNRTVGIDGPPREIFIPGVHDYQGSLRATYRFLEKWCGVDFFGPLPVNLHIPKVETLRVSGSEAFHRSALNSKNSSPGFYARDSGHSSMHGPIPTTPQLVLATLRVSWGGEPWYVNHTEEKFRYRDRFLKPVKPDDPADRRKMDAYKRGLESFEYEIPGLVGVRKDGQPSRQFCFTNQAFIDQLVKDARDFCEGKLGHHPHLAVRGLQGRSNVFPVVPGDVGGYCECEKCAPLHALGFERGVAFNGGWASDYVFTLVNAVAREVAKTHPDKFIGVLAYEGYYWPPSTFKMEKNVQIVPCIHPKNWRNNPNLGENEETYYEEWVRRYKEGEIGSLGMWNYDFDAGCMAAYYPVERGEMVKRFIRDGVKYIYHCGAAPFVEMYVTRQLYEDPNLDPQAIVDDFFATYFGPAGKAMQDLYDNLTAWSTDPRYRFLAVQKTYVHDRIALYDSILTPERLLRLRTDMNRAHELGREEPYATRLAYADKALVERYENQVFDFFERRRNSQKKVRAQFDSIADSFIASTVAYPAYHWINTRKPEALVNGHGMIEKSDRVVGDMSGKTAPNTAAGDLFEFPVQKVRYVRIENIEILTEVRVFTDRGDEVAQGKPVTVANGTNPDRDPRLITDGIAERRSSWPGTKHGRAEIDLGGVYDINKIRVWPFWDPHENGRSYQYRVIVSETGEDWNPMGTRQAKLNPRIRTFLWGRQEADGAWILFDLGGVHKLDEMHIWNYNNGKGETQFGMKDVEIAYAASPRDRFNQNWKRVPVSQVNRATQPPRDGADSIIDFGGKKVRYISIHTLGGSYHDANGVGNWNTEGREQKEPFQVGLGQVRFYGKALEMPKPELYTREGKIFLSVPGMESATIRYTVDNTLPSRFSPRYRQPFAVREDTIVRARAYGGLKKPSGSTLNKIIYTDLIAPLEVAQGKPVTCSGSEKPEADVRFINDGKAGRGSAWWAWGSPRWAQIDLGEPFRIDQIWVQPWWDDTPTRPGTYTIEVSPDGDQWTQIIDRSKSTVPATAAGDWHRFEPATARYLRINDIRWLCEIKVYRALSDDI